MTAPAPDIRTALECARLARLLRGGRLGRTDFARRIEEALLAAMAALLGRTASAIGLARPDWRETLVGDAITTARAHGMGHAEIVDTVNEALGRSI